jgi:hypothetical protein
MTPNYIWSDGIETALNNIHKNSLAICEYHSRNYSQIKGYQKYFRVPIIVLSGLNSVFSVGLQPFISQKIISVLCCSISLLCGILSSLELFIGIQTRMEKELISSKEFYILSCDIFKVLSIERSNRMMDGNIYLDTIHNKYCSLIEQSDLVNKRNKKYRLHITAINKSHKNVQTISYSDHQQQVKMEEDTTDFTRTIDSFFNRSDSYLPIVGTNEIVCISSKSEEDENTKSEDENTKSEEDENTNNDDVSNRMIESV